MLLKRILWHVKRKYAQRQLKIRRANTQRWLVSRTEGRVMALPANPLSPQEEAELKEFYGDLPCKATPFARYYKAVTGRFDKRNIPDDLHYIYIDKYLNNWDMAAYLDNKTYYGILFSEFRQPKTLAMRRKGYWYDGANQLLGQDSDIGPKAVVWGGGVTSLLSTHNNFFIKKAIDSYGGKGVTYIKNGFDSQAEIEAILANPEEDVVIQEGLAQSRDMARLNESSVNTLRIVTLMRKNGETVALSAVVRMGIGNSKVDNASSGGITVGVREDGKLKATAYSVSGKRFDCHPTSGVKFDSVIVPSYKECCRMAVEKARTLPNFRLISWDFAIGEHNEPVFIEANLCDGELDFHQLNNGPLFGHLTEEVIQETMDYWKCK